MAYLDTSILSSYYTPDPLSPAVSRALATLPDPAISPLVLTELASLLALKVRTGDLTRPAARKALAQFRAHLAADLYQLLDLTPREYDTATTWLATFQTPLHAPLRTLDALHLSCAHLHGQTLWTTDKPLAQAAKVLNVSYRLITL